MSTTLVPPTYYVVRPDGLPPFELRTLAQAATVIAHLNPISTRVNVVTGSRSRSVNASERRELGHCVRAYRLQLVRRQQVEHAPIAAG